MASNSIKGFTLLESIVVLFLFMTLIFIATQIYFNLMNSAILAQSYQLSLDNFRFGAEKIWNEIKNGSNFVISSNSLEFNNRRCQNLKIYPTSSPSSNLIFEIDGKSNLIFDNELVEFVSFNIYYDNPIGNPIDSYYKMANKIFLINYKVNLKTKITKVPLDVWQAVAPSNSVLINNPCQ